MKLSDLKPGDKATVEIELRYRNGTMLEFHIGGQCTNNSIYIRQAKNIEVTNVIRKPVEPADGQVWIHTHGGPEVTIVFVDNVSTLYEFPVPWADNPARNFSQTPIFKENYTFVR